MFLCVGGYPVPICKFTNHVFASSLFWFMKVYFVPVALFPGMPDTVLYCSLHDPVTPRPSGYNTNKVTAKTCKNTLKVPKRNLPVIPPLVYVGVCRQPQDFFYAL